MVAILKSFMLPLYLQISIISLSKRRRGEPGAGCIEAARPFEWVNGGDMERCEVKGDPCRIDTRMISH